MGSGLTSDRRPAPRVTYELAGWELFWAELRFEPDGADATAELEAEARRAAEAYGAGPLAEHPTIAALRRLFRAAGCDPTRYRPSSEALLRRVLKGQAPPAIHPLVDLNNCLSMRLAVPACVMARGSFAGPFVLREGREGESYESLKGPFNLAGKPLLADASGPCDAPITGSRRVMIRPDTRQASLVAYLPEGVVSHDQAASRLEELVARFPGVEVEPAAGG